MIRVCCGMAGRRMGELGVSVRKLKAVTVKMEAVTLIGKESDMLSVLSVCS